MGQKYRVKDNQSGKTITFQWNGSAPPSEADLEEVFSQARGGASTPPPAPTPTQDAGSRGAYGRAIGETLSNIPESAGRFAENIGNVFMHPIQTAQSIGNLASESVQRLGNPATPAPHLEALVQDLANRYGGLENLGNTIKNDPVGFLGDLSMFMGGGGSALKAAGEGTKIGEMGGELAKTAGFLDPVAGPMNAAKSGISAAIKPEAQMAKALKLPTNLKPGAADKLIGTALKEGQVVGTHAGYEKMLDNIDNLNESVASAIDASAKKGTKFSADVIIDHIHEFKKQFANEPDFPKINRKLDDLTEELIANHGDVLTIDKAQKLKQAAYKGIRDVYDQKTGERIPSLNKRWRASYAEALKNKIAELVPEVAGLNERESRLLNLKPYIEKALERREQHTFGGMVPLGAISGSPIKASILLSAREIANSPAFRSRLALATQALRKRVGTRSNILTPAATLGRTEPPQE